MRVPIAIRPKGVFDNYIYRLHNSLEIEGKKIDLEPALIAAVKSLPRYPKRASLLHPINASTINLIEFLRLSQCDLQRHIGERNSSLGKLQKSSQRLIYDIEFIRLAQLCVDILDTEDPLKNVLLTAIENKQSQLPLLLWNATFASEEFSYLFSLSSGFVHSQKPNTLYEALESLERMVGDNKNLTGVKQSDLENALAVTASRKYLGEVRRSMVLVQEGLAKADDLLLQRINQKPLCRRPAPNAQFDIVNNVFRKYYIGEVQPYIATVYQQAEMSLQLVDQLLDLQISPKAYDTFWLGVYGSDKSEWRQLKKAINLHTQHWQMLLKQCGSLPT